MFSPREIASWSSLSIYQATDREQCFTVEKSSDGPLIPVRFGNGQTV